MSTEPLQQRWTACVARLSKLGRNATLTAVLEDGPREGIDYESLGREGERAATQPLMIGIDKGIAGNNEHNVYHREAVPPAAAQPDEKSLFVTSAAETARPERVSIHIFQQDWIPGFAAFHEDGCLSETAKAHVVLNIGSFLSAIQTNDLDPKDLPYIVAESLMHEVIHVLESWAGVEFSEDRVEALLTKYREKYERATIWEYTGGEPHDK